MTFQTISMVFVMSGIVSAMIVYVDIFVLANRQPTKVMNAVWVLTALWAGIFGLWAYYGFGKKPANFGQEEQDNTIKIRTTNSMDHMKVMMGNEKVRGHEMGGKKPEDNTFVNTPNSQIMNATDSLSEMLDMAPMSEVAHDSSMQMKDGLRMAAQDYAKPACKQSELRSVDEKSQCKTITESTLHCGSGCTVANMIGEWFIFFVPMSLIAGWGLDYVLALMIGMMFQYAAIRPMNCTLTSSETHVKAFKINFWPLTAWQIGVYGWMAIAIFVLGVEVDRLSWSFWFMMQVAMMCGFLVSYPMNSLLIKMGVKKPM